MEHVQKSESDKLANFCKVLYNIIRTAPISVQNKHITKGVHLVNNFTERRLAHVWIYAIDDMADTHLAVAIAGPLMFIDHKFSLFLASLTLFAVGIFVLTALGVPWYFAWCALWLVPESIFLWKVVTTAWASSELVLENHDLILAVGPCGRLLLDQDIHGEPTVTAIPCEDKYFPRTVFLAKEGPHGATHD